MKIAFFTINPINPQTGGIERVTYNLSNEFKKRGIAVLHFCLRGKPDDSHFILPQEQEERVCFVNQTIINYKIDIIIDQYGYGNIFSHDKLKTDVKIIRCYHSEVFETKITKRLLGHFYKKKKKKNIYNLLFWLNTPRRRQKDRLNFKRSLNNTDRIIVLSNSYKQLIEKRRGESRHIEFIPNGISPCSEFSFSKSNLLLFCGRIQHNPKNVFFLIKLWERIYKRNVPWEIVIVGDGENLEEMKRQVRSKKLERIYFTGNTNPTELYKKAKILLLPSFSEAFSMTLLEAMTYQCVPIVFDTALGFHDIIQNRKNGMIVRKMNHREYIQICEKLMNSPEQLSYMAKLAKKHVDNQFNLDKICNKWINLFNDLLGIK